MNKTEYHQLLKFLYFEEYADSYEEAEQLIESMNDDEFESLYEEVFPQYIEQEIDIDEYLMTEGFNDKGEFIRDNPGTGPDRPSRPDAGRSTNKTPKPKPRKNDNDNENAEKRKELAKSILKQQESYKIVEYLVNEGFADNNESAFIILENMSEEWEEEILQEMRKEDKVKGKKETPLMIPGKRSTIQRAPEGSGTKWTKITPKIGNPAVSLGRYTQGGRGGDQYGYERHPHGGAHGGMRKGSMRGVSRMDTQQSRRAGPEITPADRVAARRASRERR